MAQQHGENLKQAMDTLRAHKLRSFLTVFGVVLGVSVIMLVAALITGFDAQVQENIRNSGALRIFFERLEMAKNFLDGDQTAALGANQAVGCVNLVRDRHLTCARGNFLNSPRPRVGILDLGAMDQF